MEEQRQAVLRTQAAGTVSATVTAIMGSLGTVGLITAVTTLLSGSTVAGMDAVRTAHSTGIGVDWQQADQNAFDWVSGYSFDLVSGINQTTANRLRKVIQDWINDGGALSDLTDTIRPIFAGEAATLRIESIFGVDRAKMIATTEATRAYAQGKVSAYTASDLADLPPEKVPPDDSHVNCRCDVTIEKRNGRWWWVWLTARDDLVCPICLPRHNQTMGATHAEVEEMA